MIVVSNRVQLPEDREETFIERLRTNHGIEEQPGFRGMKLLSPVDAEGYVTMTFGDSRREYEAWRDGSAFDEAHEDTSAGRVFEGPNTVEIYESLIERDPQPETGIH